MNKRLTDRTVEALKTPKITFDRELAGFGVKVAKSGRKSYVLVKRYPGSIHPVARRLGDAGAMTLVDARAKARSWLALLAQGIDPADREREIQATVARSRANTFAAVLEDFVTDKLAGERQGRWVERNLRRVFIPILGPRPIAEITAGEIVAVIRQTKQRGKPAMARALLGDVTRIFAWAIDQHIYGLTVSPCANLKPSRLIGQKRSRTRILTDDELFALWRATRRLPYPIGPVYQLLILTGLRLNEAAGATWSEFDLRNGMWVIPAARMKGRDGHVTEFAVPLTDDILAVLKTLPRLNGGEFLFSYSNGRKPMQMSGQVKDAVDARMLRTLRALARKRGELAKVMANWTNHDIRRTMRSGLSRLRVDRDIREAVLAHKLTGVEGVYDRHDYFAEKKDALERWVAHVRRLAQPEVTNIVALRA